MTDEAKQKLLQGMFQGANLEHANVVAIAESGATVNMNMYGGEERPRAEPQAQGKEAIMEYVGRLMPVVRQEYQQQYADIWDGILEISQVRALVYNKGKQQDTTFNRNLVAQIIHQVSGWLYVPTATSAKMAEYLEPEKGVNHPVRNKLGETPEKAVKKAVEDFVKDRVTV